MTNYRSGGPMGDVPYTTTAFRGQRITDVLQERGLSISWFCREMPCYYDHFYRIRKGERGITTAFAVRASVLLGVPSDELFFDRVAPKPVTIKPGRRRAIQNASEFWARVKRDRPNGCWEWPTARNGGLGYGAVDYEGRTWYAHRLAYTFVHGDIPDGLLVCHTCDNPRCVKPAHLYAGTHADNAQDRERRKRNQRLSPTTAAAILTERGQRPTREIAKQYGVSIATVQSIHAGRTWKRLHEVAA